MKGIEAVVAVAAVTKIKKTSFQKAFFSTLQLNKTTTTTANN